VNNQVPTIFWSIYGIHQVVVGSNLFWTPTPHVNLQKSTLRHIIELYHAIVLHYFLCRNLSTY
jgi:hypothetical protein